jgi:hypothetical protein
VRPYFGTLVREKCVDVWVSRYLNSSVKEGNYDDKLLQR